MIFTKTTFFIIKKKFLKFDKCKQFINELFKLFSKLKKRHIYGLWFLIAVTYYSATMKKILIENFVCGAKPKLAKFDQMKPYMNKLFKLSSKLKKRHIYGLWFLIAVT